MKQEKNGITIEKMDREQTTIRLPAELKERLQQEAERRGESLNGLIMIMIDKAWKIMRQDRP